MLGAIAGDIIGSPYEGMRNAIRTVDFPLFTARSRFTDDTVLTVAVADAIMSDVPYEDKLKEYFGYYPHAGFGGSFKRWALAAEAKTGNSYGNGSAMRVSPIGFAYDELDQVMDEAKRSAEVTHGHPKGIKGAQATAGAVFMARNGSSKDEIKRFVSDTFDYDLSESITSLRSWYALDYDPLYISCQKSVPPAIIVFLDSDDYEDAVRKAVSIGGDSDTIACIAGGIADAYYGGIPGSIKDETMARLDERLTSVVLEFEDFTAREDCIPVINIDADPINADWIKIVHWNKVLTGMSGPEEFREYLASGDDALLGAVSVESFRSLHYFSHLAKGCPWLDSI